MNKTKQVLKCLLLPALFFVLAVACEKEHPFKTKPQSLANTIWVHLFPQENYTYYFSNSEYKLRDEYQETVAEVVLDKLTGDTIVITEWYEVIDPVTGEITKEPFYRDSIIYKTQYTYNTLDSGKYVYTYDMGTFKLYPNVPLDEEGNKVEVEFDGYFEDGFIYIDQGRYGTINYQRIK